MNSANHQQRESKQKLRLLLVIINCAYYNVIASGTTINKTQLDVICIILYIILLSTFKKKKNLVRVRVISLKISGVRERSRSNYCHFPAIPYVRLFPLFPPPSGINYSYHSNSLRDSYFT